MKKKYLVDSNILYKLIGGKFNKILNNHRQGKILVLTSSITLTDQFNNDLEWNIKKENILTFCKKNMIQIVKVPDMLWHTDKETKSLPGPFILGISKLASNIWGGNESRGLRDVIGKEMFSNFEDIKKKSNLDERSRKIYLACLCDVYQVICGIENKIAYIISLDKDFHRAKNYLEKNYQIQVIRPEKF